MTKSVAIVTGASSGIGRATAIRLAKDFSAVVLAAQGKHDLQSVAEEVRKLGAEALTIELDLSAKEAADKVVSETLKKFGRIDALLNIAGAVPGIDVFQMTDDQWNAGMELKFHGARRLTLKAWDALKASKGSVIFVSGNGAEIPKAASAAIGAINAAIEVLAKAFSERGVTEGVQVNSVSPGAIMTPRRMGMILKAAEAKKVDVKEMVQDLMKQAGLARFGEAEEVADLMAYLVSPPARWLTGTVIRIDGGEVKSN